MFVLAAAAARTVQPLRGATAGVITWSELFVPTPVTR